MSLEELAARYVRARGSAGSGAYERFRAILGPDQLSLLDDPATLVSAHPGRRSGKTTAVIGKTLQKFEQRATAKVFYFAPTGEQGVDILWETLQTYNRDLDLGLREHWSDRWWTRGQRRLEVFSFHDRDDVERARGRWADFVDVDEAQLAPDWFTKKFVSAILPVIVDYQGQAWATGTPGEVADGFFFEACHDVQKWSADHHWTANQNPFFMRQGRDVLAEQLALHHWTPDNTTFRREWKGEWVVDPDALVYYIPDEAVRTVVGPWYGNIIGLDLGWKDHDAIGVVGVEPLRQWSHLRHMETKGQQTNHQLFRRILDLAPAFTGPAGASGQPCPIVVYDPAGHATRKTIETFRTDAPQIMWVEADKKEKVQAIEWLNNDLREGTHTVEAGCSMIREAKRLRWKRPGKLAEDADHSDQGDGWLYPWRYARDLLRKLPKKATAAEVTPFDQHLKAMREAEERGVVGGPWGARLKGIR
jgi:hypothetical protein